MFKIEIESDDGRKLDISKDNYIYFKDSAGEETYWEWEHLHGKAQDFNPIFAEARSFLDRFADLLPDLPMTAIR